MQESEINKNLDHSLLSFPGFNIETENNTSVSRVAVYVDTRINYVRRGDLEGFDSNLMVMDLMGPNQVRIINVYRSFSPQHYTNQRDKFLYQLQLIKAAMNASTIVLGDFNLDWARRFDASYAYKNYYEDMELHLEEFGLNQIVNKASWTRTINGVVKESIIDHIYLKNPLKISDLCFSWQAYTDHSLINYICLQHTTIIIAKLICWPTFLKFL